MKKFNLITLSIIILIVSFFVSCIDDPGTPIIPTEKIYTGKLEKGAFQKGAEIIAYGWDPTDGFTGEAFATLTSDDLGNYTLKSAKIKDVLYVKAEGYFFNENTGLISDGTLKLYGMVDSTKTPWNINVLTHIIHKRVMFLLDDPTKPPYDNIIIQSIAELFAEFDWIYIDPGTQSVVNNAELLLLSAAICKGRTTAEISNILTILANDLEDGFIDISILDDDFYNLNVVEIEANMIDRYGTSPSIQIVKDNLIAFRNITGPPPKIFMPEQITGYDFYYITDTGNLKGLNSTTKLIENVSINCLITQSGEADRTVPVNFQTFFIRDNLIYYTALIDNEIKYVAQFNTTVTIMEQSLMPLKPAKDRVTLTHADFQITTGFYDPYIISDIAVTADPGVVRNLMVNDFFIGYKAATYGMYYVVVDEEQLLRKSGLYFVSGTDNYQIGIITEKGELWKF